MPSPRSWTRATALAVSLVAVLLLLATAPSAILAADARQVRDRFQSRLTTKDLKALAALSAPANLTQHGSTLAPFLVPRVSGSQGNKNVQRFIIDTFTSLGWHVEQDPFTDKTPFGDREFNNIVVTKDPAAQRRLVLGAHFDSKYFEDFEFIGATDSSVPCAILVDIARTLNGLLDAQMQDGDRFSTVQLIFFDGEEALVEWSDSDSIYGSRHLAAKWENTRVAVASDPVAAIMRGADLGAGSVADGADIYHTTPLAQMDALVLLDLLGTPEIKIPNTHPESSWIWDRLVDIQGRLASSGVLSKTLTRRVRDPNDRGIFQPGLSQYFSADSIADDHVPFYRRGVPVVHCIPIPFSQVWHTKHDTGDAISPESVHDLALIFRTLVAEYLGLSLVNDCRLNEAGSNAMSQ